MKHYLSLFVLILFGLFWTRAQELPQFRVEDFDLKGNVKKCQVITDYGKEIFEFDPLGRLVQATTQYNQEDKDITTYKYDKEELVEKRSESYKDNTLDLASSMAYLYTIDTTGLKVVKEQIISYDKEFVELQEYYFNAQDQLVRVVTSHENAVDEILIDYAEYKGEKTKTYLHNGIIQKSVRESSKKVRRKGTLKIVLEKTYLDGEPNKAVEETFNVEGKRLSEVVFSFDAQQKEFVPLEHHTFIFDVDGVLSKEMIKKGNASLEKEFVFQFDGNEAQNWVKRIVTPDNTYTTRRIEYYPKEVVNIEVPD